MIPMRTVYGIILFALLPALSFGEESGSGSPYGPGNYVNSDDYLCVETLSENDLQIILKGKLNPDINLNAALCGVFLGFGAGHAVQGRYLCSGIYYTIGESFGVGAALTALMLSAGNTLFSICSMSNVETFGTYEELTTMAIIGMSIYGVIHIMEIIDVLAYPGRYNRRYSELMGR